jgi:hypothetical protein
VAPTSIFMSAPLDSFEQGQVEQSLAKLEMDGVRYALIGASGSAKNGKYYAIEAGYERALAGLLSDASSLCKAEEANV